MDSNTLERSKICHQALTKWYQLWMCWMRGSMERKALANEWKSLITSRTSDIDRSNSSCYTFLWVDASGKVWKDLSFLDNCAVVPENEVSGDVLETRLASNLCFGSGATWNQVNTSLEEWELFPLKEEETSPNLEKKYYRVSCMVVQKVYAQGEWNTARRRITAILLCSVGTASIVQLHESPVKENGTSMHENKQEMLERKTATKTNIPSRHRYIAEPSILDQYGAKPLLVETPSSEISNIETTTTTTSSSDLVGLTIQGWNIATSQGPIGDQHWFEKAQHALEPLAQFRGEKTNNKGRKLVLPEMVFPLAHIVLEYNGPTAEDRDKEQENGDDVFMVWDAMDALQEWSRAHQGIPMPQVKNDTSFTSSPFVSCRGVGVLESSDASLWKQKQSQSAGTDNNKNDSSGAIRNTEFHYDWTYSTPFCGSIFVSGQPVQSQHSFIRWQPLPKSGMPMSLLTDTSVPILYYDQILLYEDDLHDNGAVEYSIKVRVMPHCVYILGRLFVRVDHVLVRLRETRWLVELESSKNVLFSQNENKSATIYRDVTWREAAWKDLGPKYGLPSQLSAWTTDSSTREAQAFQGLLAKLPLVDLPHEVPQHAKLVYSCVFE